MTIDLNGALARAGALRKGVEAALPPFTAIS